MLEREFRKFWDWAVGIDNITTFREDFKEGFLKHQELSPKKVNKKNKIKNIKQAVKDAKYKQSKIEFLFFLLGGPFSIILSFFDISIPIFLTVYWAVLIPLEISIRKVTIDILAYKNSDQRLSEEELVFRESWNKGILKKALSIVSIPIVALLMEIHEKGYKIGMNLVEDIVWGPN